MVAPIGLISGSIAVHQKQRTLGWIGIGLSLLALVVLGLMMWQFGWWTSGQSAD